MHRYPGSIAERSKLYSVYLDGQWWITPQVCEECGLSLTNVAELLRRYHVQDLVNHECNPGVPIGYLYRITNTGLERLNYLTSDITQTSSAVADLAGLSGAKNKSSTAG